MEEKEEEEAGSERGRGRNGERGKGGKKRDLYSLPNHTLTVCSGFRVCV